MIFMDCQMPGMDGYAATAEIRRMQSDRHDVHIVAMTAGALPGDREKCLEAGMNDYVTKPLRPEDLVTALGRDRREPEPKPAAPPSAPPLDLARLAAVSGGDKDFEKELLSFLVQDAGLGLTRLEAALTAGDATTVRREAHSIKGAAANVGALPLAEAASRLEALLADGSHGDAATELPSVRLELERLQEAVAASL